MFKKIYLEDIEVEENSMEEIIRNLRSSDLDVRTNAADRLRAMVAKGLSIEEGILALQAAAQKFPPRKSPWTDTASELIRTASIIPRVEYIPIITEQFAKYTDLGKEAALYLLAKLEDRESSLAFMDLVRAHLRESNLSRLGVLPLQEKPRDPEVFFPELLEYSNIQPLEWDIYILLLTYLEQGLIESLDNPLFSKLVITSYLNHKTLLIPAQQTSGTSWMWEDDYQISRGIAALLLDVMGYLSNSKMIEELYKALSFQDPRLKLFALISLLRMGEMVDDSELLILGSTAETRNLLYEKLDLLGQLERYPQEFYTKQAFAESDMVNWLSYPTEFGQVPDQIELMKVVTIDTETDDGIIEYFLFRFRTLPPHWAAEDGWMAGVSGPYMQTDLPAAISPEGTFSVFDPWESKSPEDHLRRIQEILDK
ncbi:MAG: hypothetical protein PVF83_10495 [Anaerolineales bacterium]|jgi:hypothetical protein